MNEPWGEGGFRIARQICSPHRRSPKVYWLERSFGPFSSPIEFAAFTQFSTWNMPPTSCSRSDVGIAENKRGKHGTDRCPSSAGDRESTNLTP
jgi:hypothetical protein